MKKITKSELISILECVQAGSFMTLYVETYPEMRKTNNPFIGVKKKQSMHVEFNCSYAKKMEKELQKTDQHFAVSGAKWGEHLGKKFVEHKDNFYIKVMPKSITLIEYNYNGNKISEESIIPFLKDKPKVLVEFRMINIDNIKKLQFLGELFEVVE